MRLLPALALLAGPALAACGGAGPATRGADGRDEELPPVPADTIPCAAPGLWPRSVRSARHPVLVHHRGAAEEPAAREVLALLERSWDVEVGALGFRPPLDDTGHCGPDGAFDVFIWRGSAGCYVDVLAEQPATPHDDQIAYMVVDPWGKYGGPILDATVAHELNHALQAADDWSDAAAIYEMTALVVEDLVVDDDDGYVAQVADFQAHPDWALDHDDGYATWYMYGAGLYLRYLRDRHWGGDGAFLGELWLRMRSPADANEPDFHDALEVMLRARAQLGFLDSVVGFARWRYYTGARADGAHLEEAASFAEPTRAATVRPRAARVGVAPMALGNAYVDIVPEAGEPAPIALSLEDADPAVTWVVQVVPGASGDGDVLELGAGPQTIELSGPRTVIITALPDPGADQGVRTDARRAATLVIAPR